MREFLEKFNKEPLKKARQLGLEKHMPAPVIVKD
jgi:hypothetical protein